ncbi:MAG: hypothetical protein ACI8ZB_000809 [Desulforhopalus sp.]|jgi:hypothetical protein
MKIHCPHCGVKGSADDSYSGRKIKCPKCQDMFDLSPDMAIDQDEFPTADLGTESAVESMVQGSLQDEGIADVTAALETALPESEEERAGELLDLGEELQEDEVGSEESVAVEEPEGFADESEESLDWDDFGAELDKEIAESELRDAARDLHETEELDAGEGLFAESLDLEDLPELSDSDLSITEDGQDNVEGDDLVADLGGIFSGGRDEVAAEVDAELDTDNLASLTAPEVVMPLFVDEDDKEDDLEPDLTDFVEPDEVMVFADSDLAEDDSEEEPDVIIGDEADDEVVVENEPYLIDKEQCWQCGKKDSVGEPFIAIDGRLYCTECSPADDSEEESGLSAAELAGAAGVAATLGAGIAGDEYDFEEQEPEKVETRGGKRTFTVGGVIREAWDKVKGIKASVWAGSAVMYLVLLVIVAAGAFLLPDTTIEAEDGAGLISYLLPALFQVVIEVVSMLFLAGLLFMGIRRVVGDTVSWKMIFHGFSFTGKIVVVSILQFIFITIGFLLLILPGIYLTVGYAMAIPLIVDKNLSPWQALETSRKAVHKVWWKVAALYLVMCLIFLVAVIPLGIGLIWVWPMTMVAAGVVYHRLFGK